MINEYKSLQKEKELIELKLLEIKDFSLRSFISEFNQTNEEVQLLVISDYDNDFYVSFNIKNRNGNVYENEYTIENLNLKNIIRKGKISIDSTNEYGNHTYKSINLNYTDYFKELYSNFLKIYKQKDLNEFIFDSRKPIIYKTLKNNIQPSLNNDEYLNLLVSNNSTMEIADFLRQHSMFLISQKEPKFGIQILKDNKIDYVNYEFNNKYTESNLDVINDYNLNDVAKRYVKDLIIKSNIFNDKTKPKDIIFQLKKNNQEIKPFKELHNQIRNFLKFSPEKALKILTILVEIGKKPLEITNIDDKLKLLNLMGAFSGFHHNKSLESFYNDENIVLNLDKAYKNNNYQYLKKITEVLSFVEQRFDIIQDLQEFYKTIKDKEYEFMILNFKTKETYIDKINFEDFFNKYVIENKEINNDLEIN